MSSQPVRVLYLDHTARLSGGALALARLLGALDREQVEPIVALAEDGPLRERLAREGVEVHVIPLAARLKEVRKEALGLGGLLGQARSLADFLGYARRISRFARERRAQLIYTNSLKSDLYGGLAGRRAGIPVIWHVHDRIETDYLPRATVSMFRLLARHVPTRLVANSATTLRTLRLAGARPALVISPGLSRADIQSGDGGHATNPIPRIGIVGRIAPWKGQDLFLEAAPRVLGAGIAARFLIVAVPMFGDEDFAFGKRLREFVRDNAMADCVEFTGFIDVPPLLRTLDVLVHASRVPEPFGPVIIEGMAAGVPVIATDGGGVPEIIENGRTGLLVPMGDASALAQALLWLLRQPRAARELAAAGHRHVVEHFTIERSARLSEELYRQVAGPRAG